MNIKNILIPYINDKDMYNSLSKANKNNFNLLKLFCEIEKNNRKYKCNLQDYNIFNFFNLDTLKKETYLTYGGNKSFIKKYNTNFILLKNKAKLYNKLNKYLKRNWLLINNKNSHELKEFLEQNNNIIINYKDNIERINITDQNRENIYNKLLKNKNIIVESDYLKEEQKNNHQTIKVLVFKQNIVSAIMNFYQGNSKIIAPINIETGIIDYPALDKDGNLYEKNPSSDELILWYKVIKWPKAKRFIEKIAHEMTDNLYIELEIYSDENMLLLINCSIPDYYLYQLPAHNIKKEGIYLKLLEIEKERDEN